MADHIHYADSALQQIKTFLPVDNKVKKYFLKLILEYQFSPNTKALETITQSNEMPALKTKLRAPILNNCALIERTQEREQISNTQIQTKYELHLNQVFPEVFQKDNAWEFMLNFYRDDPHPVIPVGENKLRSDTELEPLLVSRYFQSFALEGFYVELLASSDTILQLLELE